MRLMVYKKLRLRVRSYFWRCVTLLEYFQDDLICDVIKQNKSEVGSDMLLVSDYIYISNISQ